jgi:hypothetical protein
VPIQSNLLLMTPYIVTIIVLAGLVGKVRGPRAEGIPYVKSLCRTSSGARPATVSTLGRLPVVGAAAVCAASALADRREMPICVVDLGFAADPGIMMPFSSRKPETSRIISDWRHNIWVLREGAL